MLFFDLLPLWFSQQFGSQQLARNPETNTVTNTTANVIQYDQVMTTKLAVAYAAGLTIVHCCRTPIQGGAAIDLACGPGHYTLCLARYLGYQQITGIDLASNMITTASRNAHQQGLGDRVDFRVGDITRLDDVAEGVLDLASFTDASHHMPDLQSVSQVLREMERIAKPSGLVMVMDLVRLRTAELTERYVNLLGADYIQRGLPAFFQDFRNSMYAAWTVQELRQTIPDITNRYWCHLVPRGLPTIQIIVGLPIGRKKIFLRSDFPWTKEQNPVAQEMRSDWKMLYWSLFWGSRRMIAPRRHSDQ
ncbi:MAG TPA: class I SAM-dependent methyltransferase [Gemmataceae bacterium]|nr:class I SAM-dependent methyltransferase [Gemmataceae bacterium]